MSVEKAIVSNRTALLAKYGAAGVGKIDKALQRMIAADAARNLATRIFNIDDAVDMTAVGGSAVIDEFDEVGAKAAVDAIYSEHTPDYIMLLDGPDVIPQITLDPIAGLTDGDTAIPSDLPYACSTGFSKAVSANITVTRVVGRLPAPPGEDSEKFLVGLIDHACTQKPRPGEDFRNYFGLSTASWQQSTQVNLRTLVGDHTKMLKSPKAAHPDIDATLQSALHLINCHGASGDFRFYGQQGNAYPVALESQRLTAQIIEKGTVVAAECCYGAQLFNYRNMGPNPSIWMSYLQHGAVAFMGSTNIAYGPARGNALADLMVQYYLELVLQGASTGRAMLEARQKFIRTQFMASQTNLKTLAQFVLYGDPSLQATPEVPAVDKPTAVAAASVADGASQRKARRIALITEGKSFASAASLPGKARRVSTAAMKRFQEQARQRGYPETQAFSVTGGELFRSAAKLLGPNRQVLVAVHKADTPKDSPIPAIYRVMVGITLGDGIMSTHECESK